MAAAVFPRPLHGPDMITKQRGPARSTPLRCVAAQKDTVRGVWVGTLPGRRRGLLLSGKEWSVLFRKNQAVHWGGEPKCSGTRPEVQAAIAGMVCPMQRMELSVGAGTGVGAVVTPLECPWSRCCDACWGVCRGRRKEPEQSTSYTGLPGVPASRSWWEAPTELWGVGCPQPPQATWAGVAQAEPG